MNQLTDVKINPVFDVALKLVQQGYSVLPLNPVDKRPYPGFLWTRLQTIPATADDVARWEKDYPEAMIGQICGFNGYVFLDIDVKDIDPESAEGIIRQEIIEALDNHELLKDAPRIKSPSGGRHYHFRESVPTPKIINLKDQFGNPCGEIRPDVGHYTAIPPSVFFAKDGNYAYEYLTEKKEPQEVVNIAEFLKPILEKIGVTYSGMDAGGNKEPVNTNIKDPIKNHQRDDTLFRIACSLRRDGFDEEGIYERLKHHNERCVNDDGVTPHPLEDYVLRGKARDAARKYPIGSNGEVKPLQQPVQAKDDGNFFYKSYTDFINQEIPEERWIWDETLSVGGFSIIAAKPKVGKSTLTRYLCHCVAKGIPCLNRPTTQATVLYINVEEKESEVVRQMKLMCQEEIPLHIYVGKQLKDAMRKIKEDIIRTKAGLVVLDPFFKFVQTEAFEINDYIQSQNAMQPFIDLARETNCHITGVHHMNKGGDSDLNILGSTAIAGGVDTMLLMLKNNETKERSFTTVQRYGTEFEKIIVNLHDNYSVTSSGSVDVVKGREATAEIIDVLNSLPDDRYWETEAGLRASIVCKNNIFVKALRDLVRSGKVTRWKEPVTKDDGKIHNVFVYSLKNKEDYAEQSIEESGISFVKEVA